MKEKWSTSGDFLSMDANFSTWETTITAPNGSIYSYYSHCDIMEIVMHYLSLLFALVGIAGNAIAICANPIIYFCIGSIRHRRSQRKSLKLFLQRAFQDTPEKEGGERACSRVTEEHETL
ncbi:hypothetical protein U0070_008004 [Myodes glareolus]|uniref:Uncharacterized protein n=1 Tax=Myodes glareolus TaxID=447135 RepID=A0AAW0HD40_MYOGA